MFKIVKYCKDKIAYHAAETTDAIGDIWFLHGITESAKCFSSIADTDLVNNFNIYMIDLPGFGDSELQSPLNLQAIAIILNALINSISQKRPVIIVAHSLGGTVATLMAQTPPYCLQKLILIDGMITEDKRNLRSLTKAKNFSVAEEFKTAMVQHFQVTKDQNPFIKRYIDNISLCPAPVLYEWALASLCALADNNIADVYLKLNCEKIYLYGENSISTQDITFIETEQQKCLKLPNVGHWPMLEKPAEFWQCLQQEIMAPAVSEQPASLALRH